MADWDGERWHAATAELDRLLELSPDARAARLAALRGEAPVLAGDVERLLANQDAAEAAGFLEGGAAGLLDPTATVGTDGVPSGRSGPAGLPSGAGFGPYRIVRVLGRGGMGVVYEAEEEESGRRVALKVLQERLGDEHERERFDREGRLAASLDHEHCVFVFGAAEIGGVPSIAMELMQGTLADRVASQGPMPPAAAVDAALQLVSGLAAASAAGILHRDVKPSNCFVDAGGVVKIGDFGISRSTRPTQETALSTRGRLAATPTYASPEQLRGAALDVRADIYSLGATLYELLTATRPFTGSDLMALLMAVANDTPQAPHAIVPAIPSGLSRVVLRCLAKRPDDRYPTYDALAAALEPYASVAPTPATLGRRLIAGVVDQLGVGVVTLPFVLATSALSPEGLMPHRLTLGWTNVVSFLLLVLYYGGCESLWAATPGKALFGLTVVDASGRPPRLLSCLYRATLFAGAHGAVAIFLTLVWRPDINALVRDASLQLSVVPIAAQLVMLAGLFSTTRRGNGYAALHDLATATRIVERRTRVAAAGAISDVAPSSRLGPAIDTRGSFAVVDGAIEGHPGWRPGVDTRLRRPVWIRDLPAGTPPIRPQRAALARPTRLRWLAGRRTEAEAWDVYEDVAGVPLARACTTPRPWGDVRGWLLDLAHELAAQGPDDRPPLATDRVYVLASGRAKLLDDPTTDPTRSDATPTIQAATLLRDVARLARGRASAPWPVSAEVWLRRLADAPEAPVAAIAAELDAIVRRPAAAARGRRALSLASQAVLPVCMVTMIIGVTMLMATLMQRVPPDVKATARLLQTLEHADGGWVTLAPGDRAAMEIVLASRYRAALADPHLFDPERMLGLTSRHQAIAAALLRRYGPATRADGAEDRAAVREQVSRATNPDIPPIPIMGLMAAFGGLVFVALAALVTAVATRGSVLRLVGFEVVTADGALASRLRVLARTAIAWSPVLVPVAAAVLPWRIPGLPFSQTPVLSVAVAVMLTGAVASISSPERGVQDRLAGTWLVPR